MPAAERREITLGCVHKASIHIQEPTGHSSGVKPLHLDTPHCHTIPGLTHLPGQKANPRAAWPSLQAAVNLQEGEVSHVSREEDEEHSPPRASHHASPRPVRPCQGQGEGREGDDRDRMMYPPPHSPLFWEVPWDAWLRVAKSSFFPYKGNGWGEENNALSSAA